MPNPAAQIVLPLEAGTGNLRTGPEGGWLAMDSTDSREVKFNQSGTIRTVATTTGTQTFTNKTLTAPTLTNPTIAGNTPVAFTTGTTLALTQALHANRVVWVTDVAAAYTLPAATGTGDKYTIILGATITGASTIKAASAADSFVGTAVLFDDGGNTVSSFNADAADDTVDLLGTSNSTGGIIGAVYEFWDVASGKWAVRIVSDAGGTEATPFSATVS
jgi:hypothetical protein